jgi:seryl-tRNA synthetase
MHDIRWIRDNPDDFDGGLAKRYLDPEAKRLIALDEQRRDIIGRLQAMQERRNAASKEVGQAKAARDEARAQALIAEVSELKTGIPALEVELAGVEKTMRDALAEIPNLPAADVPVGRDEHENVEKSRFAAPREESRGQHFEIGEKLGGMDFEAAAKLSGARFVVLKGDVARLERAIGQFMLDLHTQEHGYLEVAPPLLVRDEAMFGTAQLPKFREDQFSASRMLSDEEEDLVWQLFLDEEHARETAGRGTLTEPDRPGLDWSRHMTREGSKVFRRFEAAVRAKAGASLWLIPTAEVPLTNLVREAITPEAELPLRFAALTPCFRAEAGAAGRDTRGMIRQHQFNKVELVSITTPEKSEAEHERLLACAEEVLRRLELPYRVVTLCTGDMGFASKKTYDIEVWLPGQGAYREISSCSNCGDFQARRMDARYRPAEGKAPQFVHTLNGSGTAVGRALIAVLENYADQGGGVAIPSALVPYMGGKTRIEAAS